MFGSEDTAGESAISYTVQFLDAAVAKVDAKFGAGFAKANPALVQSYLTACSHNLGSFITSALALASFPEGIEEDEEAPPANKRRR